MSSTVSRCFIAAVAVVMLLSSSARPQSRSKESSRRLSGMVRRAGTAEPVAGATVQLWAQNVPVDAPEEVQEPENDNSFNDSGRATFQRVSLRMRSRERGAAPFRSVKTDRTGRFVFEDLPERIYSLTAFREGYVASKRFCPQEEHCEEPLKGAGNVEIDPVDLIPQGAIGGVVGDMNRHPLALVPVDLLQIAYEPDGRRTLSTVQSTTTNDRGEYRFHYVNPGQYRVAAGTAAGQAIKKHLDGFAINGVGPNRPIYMRQYYPNETNPDRATAIDVLPGRDVSDRNLSLVRERLHRIRGRIVDQATGRPPQRVNMTLVSSNVPDPAGTWPAASLADHTYDVATGAFEVRGILPGAYTLIVTPGNGTPRESTDTAGFARVQIADDDIDDVVVTLNPGTSIFGRITVEGHDGALEKVLKPYSDIKIQPTLNGTPLVINELPPVTIHGSQTGLGFGETSAQTSLPVQPDGRFQIDNVRPGEYRIATSGSWSWTGYYVKEVRLGSTEALEHAMIIAGPAPVSLNIVLGYTTAKVQGRVVDDSSSAPKPGTRVVLVPDGLRHHPERFIGAGTDAEGRFRIESVPPGDYRAFAWTELPENAFYNPAFLREVEAHGIPIHVTEGENPTLTLRPVPIAR